MFHQKYNKFLEIIPEELQFDLNEAFKFSNFQLKEWFTKRPANIPYDNYDIAWNLHSFESYYLKNLMLKWKSVLDIDESHKKSPIFIIRKDNKIINFKRKKFKLAGRIKVNQTKRAITYHTQLDLFNGINAKDNEELNCYFGGKYDGLDLESTHILSTTGEELLRLDDDCGQLIVVPTSHTILEPELKLKKTLIKELQPEIPLIKPKLPINDNIKLKENKIEIEKESWGNTWEGSEKRA